MNSKYDPQASSISQHQPADADPEQLNLFEHEVKLPADDTSDTIVYSADHPVRTPPDGEKAFWQETTSFLRDLVFSVLVAVLVIVFVVQPVRVEGTSMLPRLHDGERIFVNKFTYSPLGKFFSASSHIERGDIIVFWYPNDPDKSFIKRVIGLPNDTVSIRDGVVYINGQPYEEGYIDGRFHKRPDNMPATFIKNHYYFVMGDNRDSSNDSRQWGLVPEKYIYGKAIFRYWPLSNVGSLN